MKQAVLVGPRRSVIEQVPDPEVGPGEVLVGVRLSGICASELHTWEHPPAEPLRIGHEVAGEVLEVGAGVTGFRPGDRVTGLFNQGFAEYAKTTADRVIKLPDGIDYDVAFGEPLACAMSGARRTEVELGDRIAIVGLGFMGTLMTHLIRLKGPAEIVGIDLRADARRNGLANGCDRTLDPVEVEALGLRDFDLVIEATGQPEALTQAATLTRLHGRLSILGYHQGGARAVDMQLWNFRALEVLNAHERRVDYRMDCMRRSFDLVTGGRLRLDGLTTHRYPLDRVDDAFSALAQKPDGFIKSVVVNPAAATTTTS